MAVRSGLGRSGNIFQAAKGEKVAKQAPLDFSEYNKRAKEKRDIEAKRQATLQSFASQGLPEKMQSNLRAQYEAINKAVSEGMDVNSPEYLNMQSQFIGDAKAAKGFWDTSLAKANEVSKDPSKFRSTTINESGNPMYQSVEDGLASYYEGMNTAADPNLSMAQILAESSGAEQDAMVGYNDFDEKALIDTADQVFLSSMQETFNLEPTDVAGLATATQNKALYGEARERAKLAWMEMNQDALKTMALNNGVANDYTFQSGIAEEMIKKSESKVDTKTHRTSAQEAKTRAEAKKVGRENIEAERIPEVSYIAGDEDAKATAKEAYNDVLKRGKQDANLSDEDAVKYAEMARDFWMKDTDSAKSELKSTKPVSIGRVMATPSAISYKTDSKGNPIIEVLAIRPSDETSKEITYDDDGKAIETETSKVRKTNFIEEKVDKSWVINNYGQEYYDKLVGTYDENHNKQKETTEQDIISKYDFDIN